MHKIGCTSAKFEQVQFCSRFAQFFLSSKQGKHEEQPTIPTPKVKTNPKIAGVELTNEQLEKLKSGDYIYLEDITNPQNGKLFSAYVATDDELTKAFFFKNPPDTLVKYGKYEMRLMDKARIEAGFITKAKVKWWGGGFAYPYLWKEKLTDIDYRENWGDPRVEKEVINESNSKLFTQSVKLGK